MARDAFRPETSKGDRLFACAGLEGRVVDVLFPDDCWAISPRETHYLASDNNPYRKQPMALRTARSEASAHVSRLRNSELPVSAARWQVLPAKRLRRLARTSCLFLGVLRRLAVGPTSLTL